MKRRVRFVPLLVLAAALASGYSARREREATLRLDLQMMRHAIDKYTLEKEQAPQSLQDLLNGYFLKEIPTDPFTRKKDWVPQFDRVILSPKQSSTGLVDVHSASRQVNGDGIAYNMW
jgi:general secretion pathway protein G